MARCNCNGSQCTCLVLGGTGTAVTGSGHPNDPYIISNTALAGALRVEDTLTIDLSTSGAGTPDDPYTLSADSKVRLTDLVDKSPASNPQVGDVPVWQGGVWAFAPPPVAPAGAVNVTNGLTGNGAVATPVRAATSGTWGTGSLVGPDSTVGQAIYVDSAGQLRAAPTTTLHVDWANIDNKPTFFPTSWTSITGKPSTFPTSWGQIADAPKALFVTQTVYNAPTPGNAMTVRVTFASNYFTAGKTVFPFAQIAGQIPGTGYWTATFSAIDIAAGWADLVIRNVATVGAGDVYLYISLFQPYANDRF